MIMGFPTRDHLRAARWLSRAISTVVAKSASAPRSSRPRVSKHRQRVDSIRDSRATRGYSLSRIGPRASELFINPLAGMYFTFDLPGVARRSLYLERLANTESIFDVSLQIEAFREETKARPRRAIPHRAPTGHHWLPGPQRFDASAMQELFERISIVRKIVKVRPRAE